jgi:hypothetical protein
MSDIIFTPPASSGGTTINPTNDFIPVRSNATTFIDSNIVNVVDTLLYSQFTNGLLFGINLDFVNKFTYLGDFDFNWNGTSIQIDDNNQFIKTLNQGNQIGLKLDFANNYYQLGDYGLTANYTYLLIDDLNKSVFLGNSSIDSSGFYYQYTGSGDNNCTISIGVPADSVGFLFLDDKGNPPNSYLYLKSRYQIQLVSNNNGNIILDANSINSIILDPNSDKQTFTTNDLNFIGAGLQSNTAGGNSGEHLIITLNGSQYKIKLENP